MNVTSLVAQQDPSVQNASPTGVRWRISVLLGVIAALTYVDRLNLGICSPFIQSEFHFDTQTMGWILSGFSLGYALFHVPGGWLGESFWCARNAGFRGVVGVRFHGCNGCGSSNTAHPDDGTRMGVCLRQISHGNGRSCSNAGRQQNDGVLVQRQGAGFWYEHFLSGSRRWRPNRTDCN